MDIPTQGSRKPGARKLQILQMLASMLEEPKGEKVTTAALAARLDVSEAALYRHFASKAQMFEGLIEFIETTIFGLINKISTEETSGLKQVRAIVSMLLDFAQTNRGMTRVLIGDALVNENERLQERMNQLFERIEASIKQSFKVAVGDRELPESFDAERPGRAGSGLRPWLLAPIRQERLSQSAGRSARSSNAGADRQHLTVGAHRASRIPRHAHRVPSHRQCIEHR